MENRCLKDLKKRIERLEYRVRLLAQIADFEGHPFTCMVLESGLTEAQVKAIFDLMDETLQTIGNRKPMSHHKFEERIYEIVPSRRRDYHFAEDIVSTLNDEGRWAEVYRHMKRDGMNI
jgi:hypothetical protein